MTEDSIIELHHKAMLTGRRLQFDRNPETGSLAYWLELDPDA